MTSGAYPVVADAAFPAPIATLSGKRVWRTREVLTHIEPQTHKPSALDETSSLGDEELLDTGLCPDMCV